MPEQTEPATRTPRLTRAQVAASLRRIQASVDLLSEHFDTRSPGPKPRRARRSHDAAREAPAKAAAPAAAPPPPAQPQRVPFRIGAAAEL
jgi:hypothetical protein